MGNAGRVDVPADGFTAPDRPTDDLIERHLGVFVLVHWEHDGTGTSPHSVDFIGDESLGSEGRGRGVVGANHHAVTDAGARNGVGL